MTTPNRNSNTRIEKQVLIYGSYEVVAEFQDKSVLFAPEWKTNEGWSKFPDAGRKIGLDPNRILHIQNLLAANGIAVRRLFDAATSDSRQIGQAWWSLEFSLSKTRSAFLLTVFRSYLAQLEPRRKLAIHESTFMKQ